MTMEYFASLGEKMTSTKHAYRVHYWTEKGKQLEYCETVAALDEADALKVADAKYKKRPKAARSRKAVEISFGNYTIS